MTYYTYYNVYIYIYIYSITIQHLHGCDVRSHSRFIRDCVWSEARLPIFGSLSFQLLAVLAWRLLLDIRQPPKPHLL